MKAFSTSVDQDIKDPHIGQFPALKQEAIPESNWHFSSKCVQVHL